MSRYSSICKSKSMKDYDKNKESSIILNTGM